MISGILLYFLLYLKNIIKMIEASSLQEVKLLLGNYRMPTVLFLHAPWCGNCRSMYPVIQKFDSEYSDKVEFIKN
jgi:thiol-disulfide isomerase/thioredoxin